MSLIFCGADGSRSAGKASFLVRSSPCCGDCRTIFAPRLWAAHSPTCWQALAMRAQASPVKQVTELKRQLKAQRQLQSRHQSQPHEIDGTRNLS